MHYTRVISIIIHFTDSPSNPITAITQFFGAVHGLLSLVDKKNPSNYSVHCALGKSINY